MDRPEPDLVGLPEIQEAARLLVSVAVHTPLVPVPRLSPRLLIKPESLQPTGSFKLRGAYTAISLSGRRPASTGSSPIRVAIMATRWPTPPPCSACPR